MGLLKKLAELVIEFPEDEPGKPGAGKPATGKTLGSKPRGAAQPGGNDVVDAIEKIRLDLEQSITPDFSDPAAKAGAKGEGAVTRPGTPKPAGAKPGTSVTGSSQATAPGAAASATKAAAGELVTLPEVLDLAGVYQRADLTGKEFDIYKVEALMVDQEVADLEPAMRARMVRMTLKNLGKELTDILADAGRRDAALEAYARLLAEQGAELRAEVERINAAVQQEMDAFVAARTAVIKANQQRLADYQGLQQAFQEAKHAEEERLFNIAAPFVAGGANPVALE